MVRHGGRGPARAERGRRGGGGAIDPAHGGRLRVEAEAAELERRVRLGVWLQLELVVRPPELAQGARLGALDPRLRAGREVGDLRDTHALGRAQAVAEADHKALVVLEHVQHVLHLGAEHAVLDHLLRQLALGLVLVLVAKLHLARELAGARPAALLGLHRRVRRVDAAARAHDEPELVERHVEAHRQLLLRRHAAGLHEDLLARVAHPVEHVVHMHRQPDDPRMERDRAEDRLLDPPASIRAEAEAAAGVELLARADQAEAALLDQILQADAQVLVAARDGDDEAHVRVDHDVLGVAVLKHQPLELGCFALKLDRLRPGLERDFGVHVRRVGRLAVRASEGAGGGRRRDHAARLLVERVSHGLPRVQLLNLLPEDHLLAARQ
mmetsp:Transcript_10759/g.22582  ORF Transcript_10759/g.22582 Transcript_10759/m.22582 type:complete len:383 (-) Transcript_10759:583-1731(-)